MPLSLTSCRDPKGCPWPPLSPAPPTRPRTGAASGRRWTEGTSRSPHWRTGHPTSQRPLGSTPSLSTHTPQARVLLWHISSPQGQSCQHPLPNEQAHRRVLVGSERSLAGGVAQSSWEQLDDRGRSGAQRAQSKWPVSGAAVSRAWRHQTCQLKRPMNI